MKKRNTLIVIPARGGSKGIPQKNIRILNGKPLIAYTIETALKTQNATNVIVSSDDDTILIIAEKFGAKGIKRNRELAKDNITLDPVILDAVLKAEEYYNISYDLIVTIQPTSPLITSNSIFKAIKLLSENNIDTLLSTINDTHLTWIKRANKFQPNYVKRVNRQELTPIYKETGGIIACTKKTLLTGTRIGEKVELLELSKKESIDIDTFEDWNICDYYLKRKKILFVVIGNKVLGLGHVYNCLTIANDILNHEIEFLVEKNSVLAYNKIKSYNYNVKIQEEDNILKDIKKIEPDIVINDCLDNQPQYVKSLKDNGYLVINFEDLGTGAKYADLVINAMYPEKAMVKEHYFGQNYFCINDLFLQTPKVVIKEKVTKILVSFGGVDPLNLSYLVLKSIYKYCMDNNIEINIIAGLGYNKYETLAEFNDIKIKKNINNIFDFMSVSDLAFISSGRTSFEVACLGLPSIVIAQNKRETTHFFAKDEYGFKYLGLGTEVSTQEILENFKELANNYKKRKELNTKLLENQIHKGKKNVLKLINNKINESYSL